MCRAQGCRPGSGDHGDYRPRGRDRLRREGAAGGLPAGQGGRDLFHPGHRDPAQGHKGGPGGLPVPGPAGRGHQRGHRRGQPTVQRYPVG